MNVVLRFLSCAAGCGLLCVVEVILQQVWLVATTIVRVVRVHENLWYWFSYTRGGGSILLRQFQVPTSSSNRTKESRHSRYTSTCTTCASKLLLLYEYITSTSTSGSRQLYSHTYMPSSQFKKIII